MSYHPPLMVLHLLMFFCQYFDNSVSSYLWYIFSWYCLFGYLVNGSLVYLIPCRLLTISTTWFLFDNNPHFLLFCLVSSHSSLFSFLFTFKLLWLYIVVRIVSYKTSECLFWWVWLFSLFLLTLKLSKYKNIIYLNATKGVRKKSHFSFLCVKFLFQHWY